MDFQNKPHLNPPGADDPLITVKRLLEIVGNLHKHVSPKMENRPSHVARSNSEEANETNNTNDPLRSFPLSLPSLGINPDGELFLMLSFHLELIKRRLINMQVLHGYVQDEISEHLTPLRKLLAEQSSGSSSGRLTKGLRKDVDDITRQISDLVGKLSLLPDKPVRQKELYSHDSRGHNNVRWCYLPGLHANVEDLTKLRAFRQVEQKLTELGVTRQICLLSFAVFPENREVHRTMLMYWWIGEGILPVERAEETVREILKDFTEKKLIEPVEKRRKVAPSSYKMTPFVHSSVIHIAKAIGLFDIYRKGKKPRMKNSYLNKVCLVEGSSNQEEALHNKMMTQDIDSVFNVSESYPEFTFKWFSEHPLDRKIIWRSKTVFKSLRVFYLGRWERTQKRYIEVPNPDRMKCLKFMKNLRVLSFQGISTITRLKSSVCKLHKLIVLDLRECSYLVKLPEKMDSLQSLVYLDMTGCKMLEWIPMRLALLNNIEVLKGFMVCDTIYEGVACNLNYLKKLKKLRKLSIEIHRDDLSVHQLMEELIKLRALRSLKVTWRRDLNTVRAGNPNDDTKIKSLPNHLKKLDLQSFPHEELPTWLHPQKLLHLKKLHIGGGRTLKGFGDLPKNATECDVEVLRLTSLPKLRVGWIELKQLYFPKLTFLENYECPRVSLTPCDGNGIWRSDQDD